MLFLTFDTPEDENKFLLLYKTYSKTIYFTLKRFSFDQQTLEDLSQDILLILSNHLNEIDLKDHKRTQNYIITITRNISLNHLRSIKRQPIILPEINDHFAQRSFYEDTVLDNVIMNEQLHAITEEIKKMEEKYRIVLELKYLGHLSTEEIAKALSLKKKTVEVQLYRARNILRERITSHENK